MKRSTSLISFVFLLLIFSSCKDKIGILDEGLVNNQEAVKISNDSFSFSVNAYSYSYDQQHTVVFSKSSVNVSVAINSLQAGTAELKIYSGGNVILSKQFQGQTAYNKTITGKPDKVSVKLTDFTGQVAINIEGQ